MKNHVFIIALIAFFPLMSVTLASDDHGHDNKQESSMMMNHDDHGSSGNQSTGMAHTNDAMFLVKKDIDGYDVSFHVMKAKPGKEMGGSHDFMIKVEKDGKVLTNIIMNTKVINPDGTSESKGVMKMGDWFMAGYDLGHKGKHQLMILFKTKDGKKHKGGVYY